MEPIASSGKPRSPMSRLYDMLAPAGFLYEDAHYLASEVELDPTLAARFVPRPLRLSLPAVATVFTGFFPHNTFGSVYHEAGVFFHVEHGSTRAIFCPWMVVDCDVALIVGRELLGYPKKLGEIDWTLAGNSIHGVATRRGTELISMRGTLGAVVENAPPILGRPHRNVRTSLGVAIPTMIAFTPREEPIYVREAFLDVKIGGSERDPLHEMGFGRVLRSRLHRVNLKASPRGLPIPIRAVSPYWHLKQWLLRAH